MIHTAVSCSNCRLTGLILTSTEVCVCVRETLHSPGNVSKPRVSNSGVHTSLGGCYSPTRSGFLKAVHICDAVIGDHGKGMYIVGR